MVSCITLKKEVKNKIIKKDNQITTSQLAKQLKTNNNVILDCAKRCEINKTIKNGIATYWNEIEVSQIINEFKNGNKSNNRSFKLTESLKNTSTKTFDKQEAMKGLVAIQKLDIKNQIKASLYLQQDIINKLNQENTILIENNKRLEAKQEAQTLQNQSRVSIKQRWAIIDKYVKSVAKMRAESFKGYCKKNDYLKSYKYFYNEFSKMHNGIDKKEINKSFFIKYPRYMKELLAIIIADEGLKIKDEELKMF